MDELLTIAPPAYLTRGAADPATLEWPSIAFRCCDVHGQEKHAVDAVVVSFDRVWDGISPIKLGGGKASFDFFDVGVFRLGWRKYKHKWQTHGEPSLEWVTMSFAWDDAAEIVNRLITLGFSIIDAPPDFFVAHDATTPYTQQHLLRHLLAEAAHDTRK